MAEKNNEDQPKATRGDEPKEPVEAPALSQMGGTFAERAKARESAEKRIRSSSTEDKAVKKAASKAAKKA